MKYFSILLNMLYFYINILNTQKDAIMREEITSKMEQNPQNGYEIPFDNFVPEGFMPSQIEGILPRGKKLKTPIQVFVNFSSGEFIISEHEFYNYATGVTLPEALEAFKETLVASLESLTIEEPKLGGHLQDELTYLRSIIN